MASILVIGTDAAFYDAFCDGLRQVARYECLYARTAADGLTLARAAEPELVVLSWSLPDRTGLEVCKSVLEERNVPVIFVAVEADEQRRVEGFLAGARDFVVMPVSVRELALRARAILRRRVDLGRREIAAGSLRIDRVSRRVWVAEREISLTRVELDLLLALHNSGHACSREALRDRAWGRGAAVEPRSVDTYVKRLRRKLGDAGGSIETVRNVGYRLATEPPPRGGREAR